MKLDGYDIEVVMQGFPGKSICHGGARLGLGRALRGEGRVAFIDVGSFGMRKLLRERLAEDLEQTTVFRLTLAQ